MLNDLDTRVLCEGPKQRLMPSKRQLLLERRNELEFALVNVNEAIKFLDNNPSFEEGLEVLSRALR